MDFALPRLFRNPVFRTFFHFPWDFEIAEFDCTYPLDSDLSGG